MNRGCTNSFDSLVTVSAFRFILSSSSRLLRSQEAGSLGCSVLHPHGPAPCCRHATIAAATSPSTPARGSCHRALHDPVAAPGPVAPRSAGPQYHVSKIHSDLVGTPIPTILTARAFIEELILVRLVIRSRLCLILLSSRQPPLRRRPHAPHRVRAYPDPTLTWLP
jgi:hypothetical protein